MHFHGPRLRQGPLKKERNNWSTCNFQPSWLNRLVKFTYPASRGYIFIASTHRVKVTRLLQSYIYLQIQCKHMHGPWKGNNNKPSAAHCMSNALQLANEYPGFTPHVRTTFNDAWQQTFSVLPSNLLKSWNKGT